MIHSYPQIFQSCVFSYLNCLRRLNKKKWADRHHFPVRVFLVLMMARDLMLVAYKKSPILMGGSRWRQPRKPHGELFFFCFSTSSNTCKYFAHLNSNLWDDIYRESNFGKGYYLSVLGNPRIWASSLRKASSRNHRYLCFEVLGNVDGFPAHIWIDLEYTSDYSGAAKSFKTF